MRRPIGWIDKDFPGGRREVKVEFFSDTLRWRFKPKGEDEWQEGEPTEENWDGLEERLQQLIQRGHIFNNELALVKGLRAGTIQPKPLPTPSNKDNSPKRRRRPRRWEGQQQVIEVEERD